MDPFLNLETHLLHQLILISISLACQITLVGIIVFHAVFYGNLREVIRRKRAARRLEVISLSIEEDAA